jgi:CheY-like chemotaxis protein
VLLVVDDDAAIRETLADLLRDEGYVVVTASNGQEALDRLHESGDPPCLIILDLMMPIMSGDEFYREKQADPQLADIPVVVISADHNLPRKATKFGGEYLAKPVKLDVVIDTVERHCA